MLMNFQRLLRILSFHTSKEKIYIIGNKSIWQSLPIKKKKTLLCIEAIIIMLIFYLFTQCYLNEENCKLKMATSQPFFSFLFEQVDTLKGTHVCFDHQSTTGLPLIYTLSFFLPQNSDSPAIM